MIGKDEPTSETNFLEFMGADSQGLVPSHNESSFLEVADSDELPQAHNYRWKYAVLGTTLAVTGLAAALYLTFPGKISFDPKKAEPAVSAQEYLQIPCDDDPECFALKLRVSDIETQLGTQTNPIIKTEVVEIPCEDNSECSALKIRVSDLETQLDKPVQPQYIKEECDNTPLLACQGELYELRDKINLWVGQREAEKADCEVRVSELQKQGNKEREEYRIQVEGLKTQLSTKPQVIETLCDITPLLDRQANVEALLSQLANPVIKTEVVELPCETNPIYEQMFIQATNLQAKLDALLSQPPVPATPVLFMFQWKIP